MAAEAAEGSRRYAAEELDETPSFCNAFWGNGDAGYEAINARMKTASRTLEEVRALYKERAEIEADYAKRLGKLAKSIVGKEETGSTRQALEVVRAELDMTSRVHGDLSVMIKKDLEGAIAEYQTKSQGARKTAAASIEKLFKNKQAQETYVNKSRERYEQDCIKINGYTAQSSLVQGRDLDKVTSKLDKAQSTVQANDKDYQNFVRALKDTTLRWNNEWKAYLDQCQDVEEERLDFVKSNLWNYANAISAVCVADDEGCERIRVALENCETPKDIAVFVQQRGTGAVIPDAPEYINYARGQHGPGRPSSQIANFVRQTTRPTQPPPPPPSQSYGGGPGAGSGRDGGGQGGGGGGATGESDIGNGVPYQSMQGNGAPAAEALPPSQSQYKPVAPPSGGVGLPGMVLPEQTGPNYQQLGQHQPPVATPPKPERRMSAKNFLARTPSNRMGGAGAYGGSATSYNSSAAPQSASRPSSVAPDADEDPIAKALASLRMKSGGKSPAPSQQGRPNQSSGPPPSTLSTSSHRYSQLPPGRAPSPGPSVNGSIALPSSPSAAFMQGPQRSHSPLPVEDIMSSYGQSFPGERKSISLSRRGSVSSAVSSTRVNVAATQPAQPPRGRSPAPSGEGFAGVGARGRSPSPQPYQGDFRHQATPSQDARAQRHQAQSSISAPQHAPQRAGTPLGISLDASGSVTHDQMAQEYMQRTGSVPPPQQPAAPAAYQQQSSSQYQQYQPQQPPQGGGYVPPASHQRPGSVVHGQQQHGGYSAAPPPSQTAPGQYHQGQPPHGQHAYQQSNPQYSQGAPSFQRQDSSSAVGYNNYGQQQQGVVASHSYAPGRGSTPGPSAGGETPASAYMHQYQRQSNLASSTVGQQHEPQRWSQHGAGASQPPPSQNGGYAPPAPHQQPPAPMIQQPPPQQQQQQQAPPPAQQQQQQQPAIAPTGQYSDTGKPIVFYVKAMYDYTATTEEEFSFTLGDIIAVTQTDPDGWWQGELLDEARRKRGANTFPSNFTNLLT